MSSEQHRIELLRRAFEDGAMPADSVLCGIGDDAAILTSGTHPLVWTVDAAVEGVHFRRDWMSLFDIGWRSFMAAASDLGAMGAAPRGALSALVLPRSFSDDELIELARGQGAAAAAAGTRIIGGNLAGGGELSITTTLLGQAEAPLRRDGARAGDRVYLSGRCGFARAGLELLRSNRTKEPFAAQALDAFRRPVARIDEGRAAAGIARAAIDVSDGLSIDAHRMAAASGVRIVLDESKLLSAAGPELSELGAALGIDARELVLSGGDDYALLVTAPFDTLLPAGFHEVGICERGEGLALVRSDKTRILLPAQGFDHFAES